MAVTGPAKAQTGLIFDEEAYQVFPLLKTGAAKNQILPSSFSLRKYCPFPQSQGSIASCVGWAVGYGALTIDEAVRQGISDRAYITDELTYSASYIFNQIKKGADCMTGASLTDALNLLSRQGACRSRTFPNSRNSCDELPGERAREEASRFRMKALAYRLFDTETAASAKTEATRIQVALGSPVIVGFSTTPGYSPLLGKPLWQPDRPNPGGHAMVVTGYNDRLKTFELMNSFGQSWGQNGFISISYEDFGAFARQGFVLRKKDKAKGDEAAAYPDIPVPMSGMMILQYASGTRNGNGELEPVQAVFQPQEGAYRAMEKDWKLDEDLFRIQVVVPRGRCAYLFGVDTEGSADSLWAMEPYFRDTVVTLPPRGYFQFSRAGEEHLCLLISYEAISRFSPKLRQIRAGSALRLSDLVRRAFPEDMIAPDAVSYDAEAPAFRSESRYGHGIAVPLILSLRFGD